MTTFSRAATAAAVVLALSFPLALAGSASASPLSAASSAQPVAEVSAESRAELPRPTGTLPVGSSVLHLVDRSRPDPWMPDADGRELMVTLHYPAAHPGRGHTAPYASTEETQALIDGYGLGEAITAADLSAMRTYARRDVRPAPGRYPLVVLSPGFTVSRYTLTALAEDLASRGYVVASVDHAYESLGIRTPDGRLLTCAACGPISEGEVPESKITTGRARDVSYVVDRLTGRHAAWKYAGTIDRRRIAMAGHSIGGASAMTAMLGDERIRAGINMDGAFYDSVPEEGLGGRPFMLLGTDDEMHRPGGLDHTWDTAWHRFGGWKRWLTLAGSDHFTFTDGAVILDHFGVPRSPLPADRALALTRAYVAAFFDQHLKGIAQPLLDGPSAANPEMIFHNP
ncbi:alpha/beta hydrolase [Streptomyces sp. TBY4]|uniref:alpha/beta hydrolase family protein n=1 Tax=Streptomyces sp. TBY4 TaxID=2962030 RepID=UPI0020B7F914|nr:alpha/beta hydrolase [Streptomyces sp. TBY4]MCP3758008.1 alpha/beta hydrolase [Streptomyces sp. TBY4]